MKLRRIAFGNLTLDGLTLGAFRDLTPEEVTSLYEQVGDLGNVPIVRSKSGVRYARGFSPSERTKVRQTAPSKEELDRRDSERKMRVEKRPRPSRIKIEESNDKRRPMRGDRKFDDNRRFESSWDSGTAKRDERNDRDERKSFPRGDRDERKSFPRGDRDERKSFPRGDRDERKSFPRGDRDERKSFGSNHEKKRPFAGGMKPKKGPRGRS